MSTLEKQIADLSKIANTLKEENEKLKAMFFEMWFCFIDCKNRKYTDPNIVIKVLPCLYDMVDIFIVYLIDYKIIIQGLQ